MTSLLEGSQPGLDAAVAAGKVEMLAPDGRVRDHWRDVHDMFAGMSPDELRKLRRQTQAMLRDDGVTYHVPGTGERRAWQLDPIPLVIAADEWAEVEAGIIQRAELLNLILGDVYGSRSLLTDGMLPPATVFGHPAFLRQMQGARLPGLHQLFTYAADLARSADGSWVVVSDRTQAPSGAAYALQNRSVTSRVLGRLHRTAGVQRVEPYFRALRKGLQQVAPPTVGMPRTVVLSPGSRNETAFEHALLASRLGLSLVEGSDLLVTGGRVFLKTLGHPEPVDVIVRRIDEGWCDPLELRPESVIGVPGLVDAVRLGHVSVVNSLGSGVLENPALAAWLPDIATKLLGQSLQLKTAQTHWLGDQQVRRDVLSDMSQWIFKPLARVAGDDNTFVGREMDRRGLNALKARVQANPRRWTAQQPITPALAPTLEGDQIVHRPTVLRVFAVADGSSYTVLPGGLTRVARSDSMVIANHQGAWAKDTWVLGGKPDVATGFWTERLPAITSTPDQTMSSRAGQNLYWLGRYAERAEGVARLLREIDIRRTEFADTSTAAGRICIRALLQALTHITTTYPGFVGAGSAQRLDDPDPELHRVVSDARAPGTLAHAISQLLDAVDSVRDQLSSDTWLVVVDLRRRVDIAQSDSPYDLDATDVARILHGLLAIQGLAAENMVRDQGWRFMDAGRRIERALQIISLLRATTTHIRKEGEEGLIAESILRVAESIVTYRRRYQSTEQTSTLLDLLLLDPDNPRSLTYQFDRLADDLRLLPGHPGPGRITAPERPVLEASTALRVADTTRLAEQQDGAIRSELDQFLSHLYGMLLQTAKELDRTSFDHTMPQRPLRTDTAGNTQ